MQVRKQNQSNISCVPWLLNYVGCLCVVVWIPFTNGFVGTRSRDNYCDSNKNVIFGCALDRSTRMKLSSALGEEIKPATTTMTTRSPYCSTFGGELRPIRMEGEEDGFLAANTVPTYAAIDATPSSCQTGPSSLLKPEMVSLSDKVPGAFVVYNVLSQEDCEDMIRVCEEELKIGKFAVGKNNHGALQILVSPTAANSIARILEPFVSSVLHNNNNNNNNNFEFAGINRRWRIYRYEADGQESFAPHIDCGFPPSALSHPNPTTLIWDARQKYQSSTDVIYRDDIFSRLTLLLYLNDDFEGGHTVFYPPKSSSHEDENLTSVQPKRGSILLFPQAAGNEAREFAEQHWPRHEGSPVSPIGSNRPKYVIRSDVLMTNTPVM